MNCGAENKDGKRGGFTLVEIMVYIVLFMTISGFTVGILFLTTRITQREAAAAEITNQLNLVTYTIQRLVKESSAVDITAGVDTSVLTLRMRDPSRNPTVISLDNGAIKIKEGQEQFNFLTNDRVLVTSLTFKKFTQYPGHDIVSVNVAMSSNTENPESRVSRTLSSAVARVQAATFDDNLLPGGTPPATFTIGNSNSPWKQIFLGDGSALNPSYTFNSDGGLSGMYFSGGNLGFSTGGTARMVIDSQGRVGIGTETPGSPLTLVRTESGGNIYGIRSEMTAQTPVGTNLFSGYFLAQNANQTNALYANAYANVGISELRGLYAYTWNDAVGGTVTNQIGLYTDVDGTSGSNTSNAYGLFVEADNNAGNIGNFYGAYIDGPLNYGQTVTNNYGLYIADRIHGTNRYSIYSAGGTSYFGGNVGIGTTNPGYTLDVNGTFAANIKNFDIPHPLDSSRRLIHSSLEGPEIAVYYRGSGKLKNGRTTIKLPAYFEALVRPEGRTILLTNIDGADNIFVETADGVAIKNGEFIVVSDNINSEQKFFWEVKGVRSDQPLLEAEK